MLLCVAVDTWIIMLTDGKCMSRVLWKSMFRWRTGDLVGGVRSDGSQPDGVL